MATVVVVGGELDPEAKKQLEGLGPCGFCGSDEIIVTIVGNIVDARCGGEVCRQMVTVPGIVYKPTEIKFK